MQKGGEGKEESECEESVKEVRRTRAKADIPVMSSLLSILVIISQKSLNL
jgi:hypothetical protein